MAGVYEDKDRRIIPRWRLFQSSHSQREVHALGQRPKDDKLVYSSIDRAISEWNENPTSASATELLVQAASLNRLNEFRDAAETILASHSPFLTAAKVLARRSLGLTEESTSTVSSVTPAEVDHVTLFRQSIHVQRDRLNDEPRNPIRWTDLAFLYASLGLGKQADHAMRIAVRLAPSNRFVLRSASRLYVHMDEYGKAHDLLRQQPRTRTDPWLMAAEIAVAGTARRTSKNIRAAREFLERRSFAPSHLTELASALATLEAEAGNTRNVRKLIRLSLSDPTENAIAQAAWLERRTSIRGMDRENISSLDKSSYEAAAWESYRSNRWHEAIRNCEEWLQDQPFSSRPPILGSYVAAVVESDYEKAVSISKSGLLANPDSFILLNNCAFALLQQDKTDEARRYLQRIDTSLLTKSDLVVWHATFGLLQYRAGNIEEGRESYLHAIQLAEGDPRRWIMAKFYFVLEDARATGRVSSTSAQESLSRFQSNVMPDLIPLSQKLQRVLTGTR